MALGNANSSAQARGKNKPVIVKRRKEVVMAKGYRIFQISTVLAGVTNAAGTCSSTASITKNVYHDGARAKPEADDLVYIRVRASEKYLLEDGCYRASISSANHYLIITSGKVHSCGTCR